MDNLTTNNESFVEILLEKENANCTNLTDYESKIINIVSWALEYVCILFIGITGFLGNCIAIYILTSSEKFNSAFNKGWIMNSLIFSNVNTRLITFFRKKSFEFSMTFQSIELLEFSHKPIFAILEDLTSI